MFVLAVAGVDLEVIGERRVEDVAVEDELGRVHREAGGEGLALLGERDVLQLHHRVGVELPAAVARADEGAAVGVVAEAGGGLLGARGRGGEREQGEERGADPGVERRASG